jgi:transcriptional regulator GlxA family with amidase domain
MATNIQNQTKPLHSERSRPHLLRHVCILGFADVLLLDIAGPAQVFGSANKVLGREVYRVSTVTQDGAGFVTDTGLMLYANGSFDTVAVPNDLVVPGGPGVDALLADVSLRAFVHRSAAGAERIISICSGSLLTAAAGLLEGKHATTHWERASQAYAMFPNVVWQLDKIFTKHDKFYCSAGVTTGIDLALSLVEADHGREVALSVAREMVVFMQRHGGQSQYSEPLKAQASAQSRFGALYTQIEADPTASWTLSRMAQVAGATERTLHREFVRHYRQSPSRFVEERRIGLAREYLESSRKPIKEIAHLAGFGSEQMMRRSFFRCLGVLPSDYRQRFGALGSGHH